jgi:hypothetical protein
MSNLDNSKNNINNRNFTSTNYNVNNNHPLIQNSQEYLYVNKYISIHSEDRDLVKYPNSSDFEIELPEDYLNIAGIRLEQWAFPSNYNTFSAANNNIKLSFLIDNPYNPNENSFNDLLSQRIFQALFLNMNNPYEIIIEEGFYNPNQFTTELQNKLNDAVTVYLLSYFQEQGWDDSIQELNENDGYQRFVIAYNLVSLKVWFGNQADGFKILNNNENSTSSLNNDICVSNKNQVPNGSNYGLSSFIGLPRYNISSINSSIAVIGPNITIYNGIAVPRFFYGSVNGADNGYWLLPVSGYPGCNVHWIESPYKLNILGEAYFYMELAGQNCIDETQPWNKSIFTSTTNQSNGIVNSSFAKIPVPSTPLSQWFDKESKPTKWYLPPAERIRKLKIKFRYHNGQLVDFGLFNYSFMLQFILVTPQILRTSQSVIYPPITTN